MGGIQQGIIEDTFGQAFPTANAEDFSERGNHHGKTAAVKIDLAYDLFTGSIIFDSFEAATIQDKRIGKEVIAEVASGDFVL